MRTGGGKGEMKTIGSGPDGSAHRESDAPVSTLKECFDAIVDEVRSPFEVVELFYLTREQSALPMLRNWLSLDTVQRANVHRLIAAMAMTAHGDGVTKGV